MKFLVLFIVVLVTFYGGYKLLFPNYPTYSWHQKMTVEVETRDGIKTGSSVTSVKWTEGGNWSMGWNWELKGEAVVVDMGGGKFLFALLRSAATTEYMGTAFAAAISKRKGRVLDKKLFDEVANKRDRASSVIELPDYQYPLLVRFKDINDPASVQKIDSDDLAAIFGKGVRLRRITLEVSDEPVAKGKVGKVLGWFYEVKSLIPLSAYPKLAKDMSPEQKISINDFIDWRTQYKRRKGSK